MWVRWWHPYIMLAFLCADLWTKSPLPLPFKMAKVREVIFWGKGCAILILRWTNSSEKELESVFVKLWNFLSQNCTHPVPFTRLFFPPSTCVLARLLASQTFPYMYCANSVFLLKFPPRKNTHNILFISFTGPKFCFYIPLKFSPRKIPIITYLFILFALFTGTKFCLVLTVDPVSVSLTPYMYKVAQKKRAPIPWFRRVSSFLQIFQWLDLINLWVTKSRETRLNHERGGRFFCATLY